MNIQIEDKKLTIDGVEIELGTTAKVEIEITDGKPKLKITTALTSPVYPNYPSIWTTQIQPQLPYTVTCQSNLLESQGRLYT